MNNEEFSYQLMRDETGKPVCIIRFLLYQGDVETLTPDLSQKLYNHSLDGFEWGYHGSGPAQLALAILADYFSKRDIWPPVALQHYQEFKRAFIATMPQAGGEITSTQIDNFINHENSKS